MRGDLDWTPLYAGLGLVAFAVLWAAIHWLSDRQDRQKGIPMAGNKIEIEFCPICGAQLAAKGAGGIAGGAQRQGLTVTVGYSDGGWGSRRNSLEYTNEVCKQCDHELRAGLLETWHRILEERKDKNKTFVVVTNPTGNTEVR